MMVRKDFPTEPRRFFAQPQLCFFKYRYSCRTCLTYPGHGGSYCAEYISKILPQTIAQNITKPSNLPISSQIVAAFKEVDDSIVESLQTHFKSTLSWPMPASIRHKAIDVKLKPKDIREMVLRARSGSTALAVVIDNEYITVGNVGDCRAGQTFPRFNMARSYAELHLLIRTYNSSGPNIFIEQGSESRTTDDRSKR
jgi:hypothetical protein